MKPCEQAIPPALSSLAESLSIHMKKDIFPFWLKTMDHKTGGFAGLIQNDGSIDWQHPKGIVMHSRHLWAYSRIWLENHEPHDLVATHHAYDFLSTKLYDPIHKGFWWTVDTNGQPLVRNKILYGQAFAIYGLAQYYQATHEVAALDLAMETFSLVEQTGRDPQFGGYYEAVDDKWTKPIVQALSEIDLACTKSMNTNLHMLEAFTCLFQATGSAIVREALQSLLEVFEQHILVTPDHLGLYFDRDWKNLSDHQSYGHDIEASWLLTEAATVLWPEAMTEPRRLRYLRLAEANLEVLQANDGTLPNELSNNHLDASRIWWVQAEAMVGMVNAWELTGEEKFLSAACQVWQFIQDHMIDHSNGEWFWEVDASGQPNLSRPKGGLWKTSYHNGRACLEIIQRARQSSSYLKVQS